MFATSRPPHGGELDSSPNLYWLRPKPNRRRRRVGCDLRLKRAPWDGMEGKLDWVSVQACLDGM